MHPHVPSRSSGAYYALYLYIYIHILNFPILPETQIRYLPNSQKNLKSEIDGKPRLRITLSLSRSFITMLLEEKEPFLQFFPKTCLCMETGTQSLMTCYWNRSVGCLPQKEGQMACALVSFYHSQRQRYSEEGNDITLYETRSFIAYTGS